MKSGKQKGVLIPAALVSLVCTVALSAFCMFIQVGMTMQAQDEDIRECMDAVMEAVSEVSGNYDQNIATFDEVYRAKAATAAYIARYDKSYRETGYWVDQLGQQMEVTNLMILDSEGAVIAGGETMAEDYSLPEFDGLRDVFISRKRHQPFEVTFGSGDNAVTRRYYASRIDSGREAVVEQDPEELNAVQLDTVTWSNVLADIDVGVSGLCIAFDSENYEIQDYPEKSMIGKDIRDLGLRESDLQDRGIRWITLNGKRYYAGAVLIPEEDIWVLIAVSEQELIDRQKISTAIIAAVFFAFPVILLVYAFSLFEEDQKARVRSLKKIRGFLVFGLVLVFVTSWYAQNLFAVSSGALSVENDLQSVKSTIETNREAQEEIKSQYNRRYLNKALMASQILSRNPELKTRMDLAGLSRALDVEYIVLFDRTGLETVSDSEFVRFRLSSNPEDQSYEFRKLMYGVPYVVQDAQPDELTGRYHQFIGAALRDENGESDGFLQISVLPDKLENMLKAASLDQILSMVRASFGGFAFAVDGETKTFIWYPDSDLRGKKATDYGIKEEQLRDGYTDYLLVDGTWYFAASGEIDGNYIYVAVPERRLVDQSFRFAGVMTCGAAVLLLLVYLLMAAGAKLQEKKLQGESEDGAAGSAPDAQVRSTVKAVEEDEDDEIPLPGTAEPESLPVKWAGMTALERAFLIFRVFLMVYSAVIASISLFRSYLPSDSIFTYLFSGKWERGLNLFSVTCSLMAAGGAGVVVMILDRLLSILGNAMDPRGETICRLLKSIVRYAAILIMIFYTLSLFGVNPGAILASAGLVTVIIGIGSQSLISDILSGLFIIFEGDFQVGDIVTINDCRGVVQEIGVRNTKILDDRGNLKIINNKQISGILNMTARNSICLTDISIEYDEDIPRLERILAAELPRLRRKLPAIRENPRYLGVQSLGDSAIVIRILTECREADRFQLERDMNRELRLIFERHGINIPFPQIVVNRRKEES